MNRFDAKIQETMKTDLFASSIRTIQVNIGLKCNLACEHCHVVSSPLRTETMSWETMEQVLDAVRRVRPTMVDITGGAPEMNPHFRRFVRAIRAESTNVLVRTNLTIMQLSGYTDLPGFYKDHRVHLVASLPCYTESNVDRQRGQGVFNDSLAVLKRLNELGYGIQPDLPIDLVYNPIGPALPPPQVDLEKDYKQILLNEYGIHFTRLLTITNMPIGRFFGDLKKQNRHEAYRALLYDSFNPSTLDGLMCRHQISVRWDGTLFDCDFNLALHLPIGGTQPAHIRDFQPARWSARKIITGEHCFGCTAGQGSSCGGALTNPESPPQPG